MDRQDQGLIAIVYEARLAPEEMVVWLLMAGAGLEAGEVAGLLSLKEGTVRNYSSRANVKLTKHLSAIAARMTWASEAQDAIRELRERCGEEKSN